MKNKTKEKINWSSFRGGYNEVVKRDGYSGFLSFIWWAFKKNRSCKERKMELKYTLIFPIQKWLK